MTTATPVRRQSGLALYFAVTFATTWAFWLVAIALGGSVKNSSTVIPYVLGGFGPVIGAIVVRVRRARRREPAPAHTVRLRLSMRLGWVLPLLVMASATVLAGAMLAHLLGGPVVSSTEGRRLISDAGGPVPFFVGMLVAGPLSEEPGWRGTACPRMRASLSRLQAGLLLGVIWAVWHVPLFFVRGTLQAGSGLISWSGLLFVLSVIPVALLTGYAYERAGVAASIAVHLGVNGTIALLSASSPSNQASIVAVQSIVAITLLAWRRSPGGPAGSRGPSPTPGRRRLVASDRSDPKLINSAASPRSPRTPVTHIAEWARGADRHPSVWRADRRASLMLVRRSLMRHADVEELIGRPGHDLIADETGL